MEGKDDSNSPEEIEITPEMIAAGARAICACGTYEGSPASAEYFAERAIEAALKARRGKHLAGQ